MQAAVRDTTRGGPIEAARAAVASPPELECRVCELETENARLRLLVGELLVANQSLRESLKLVRAEEPAA